MYHRGTVLRWFSSKEEFLCWCGASAHLIAVASVPSLLEAERKHRKKERLRKRAHLSIKGESLRNRKIYLKAAMAPGIAFAAEFEAFVEPTHKGMVGPTTTSPLEGFFIIVKGDSLVEPDSSFEGFRRLPPLKGTPQVIDLKEERDVSLL
ncbi:hypothetical protein ACLOJK_006844, partial [Asimina triloba]